LNFSLDNELDIAKRISIEAGNAIIEIYNTSYDVEYKKDNSPVTTADKRANDIIKDQLIKIFPNYSILTEESEDDLSRLKNEWCWIIDPMDGTKEFLAKNGEFTVNIGLSYKSKIVLGVVYAPILKELYFGVKGLGSFLFFNNEIIKLNVTDKKKELTLIKSRSHNSSRLDNLINKNSGKIGKILQMGSSLKGCMIAKGAADIYYRFGNTMEWDTAAVQCIIEEAGGIVKQLDDTELTYNRKNSVNDKGYYILNHIDNKMIL
jgi:3'(2'), 5'-bisphosphate nucleotidase